MRPTASSLPGCTSYFFFFFFFLFFLPLFLCCGPDAVQVQAASHHGTASLVSGSTTARYLSATPSLLSSGRLAVPDTVCLYRTINYITHALPQQCAKSSWPISADNVSMLGTVARPHTSASDHPIGQGDEDGEKEEKENRTAPELAIFPQETGTLENTIGSRTKTVDSEAESEPESPLDNANFLSFEEWKKKNLAQAGQSPENVGQGRAVSPNQPARRREVNINALDSLGDEGEMELDFIGFGTQPEGKAVPPVAQEAWREAETAEASHEAGKIAPGFWTRSKDAGKTCKERFNYASFDCAATVLKANQRAKSLSSILVENKDSYMLNECAADNKFLIVELCDDILVDTVVLANYEFFSSIFHHFRVSISDRYPVKLERWRTLGTFEARNSREIQPFLVTEPQIWARYLRIEFLTQYGNEFYCPLSLLRVHGTTMMEQFRREEEDAREMDDEEELDEASSVSLPVPMESSGPMPSSNQIPMGPVENDRERPVKTETASIHVTCFDSVRSPATGERSHTEQVSSITVAQPSHSIAAAHSNQSPSASENQTPPLSTSTSFPTHPVTEVRIDTTIASGDEPLEALLSAKKPQVLSQSTTFALNESVLAPSQYGARDDHAVDSLSDMTRSASSSTASPISNHTASSQFLHQSPPRSSPTQPNPAIPSTQESFFKSIHKRLVYLEANSTLSLQYIEEQSRILRDAFVKVEKRQLAKTEKFLDYLNSTVMQELKSYRNMYDQLWQSTVMELESMKERQKAEIDEIGSRLSMIADEMVWQKRMAVVQSILLLLCLFFVLFVRSGTVGAGAEVPIVQQLVRSKYSSLLEASPSRSPPTGGRRRRGFGNIWRSDMSGYWKSDAETDGRRSPDAYNPPTPDSPSALSSTHEALTTTGAGPSVNSLELASTNGHLSLPL